jgi:hypothetical protein
MSRYPKSDLDSRLFRNGKTVSELRYMGHTPTDNPHGLVVDAMVTHADGYAERETAKAMIRDARQAVDDPETEGTRGADKGYDAAEFIEELGRLKVTLNIAQNKSGRRSAVGVASTARTNRFVSITITTTRTSRSAESQRRAVECCADKYRGTGAAHVTPFRPQTPSAGFTALVGTVSNITASFRSDRSPHPRLSQTSTERQRSAAAHSS